MKLNNLRAADIKRIKNRFDLNSLKLDGVLLERMKRYDKEYVGDLEVQRAKFVKFLTNRMNAQIAEMEHNLDAVINSAPLFHYGSDLIITVEWKKSYMWGMNPTAWTNYGFRGTSIGGCGYCKLSTATAQALNDYLPILKLMYIKKNRVINQGINNHELLGYGSDYFTFPSFEGGVGVNCHQQIIEKLGLKWKSITHTDHVDVYSISK